MNRSLACSLLVLAAACGSSTSSSPSKVADNEDERGSIGVPPTAEQYCLLLGYSESFDAGSASYCVFPDGTRCEEYSFFRGECGQPHSYCNLHGGSIREVTVDAGTFTEVYAVCTRNGVDCQEGNFVASGKCE